MNNVSIKNLLSSQQLKIIALTCMFIQHFTYALIKPIYGDKASILMDIGNITFPIIIFLLVEGFIHTKNLKKYLIRIFIMMIISEIPYRLIFSESEGSIGNIMLSLLLVLITISIFRVFKENFIITIIVVIIFAIIMLRYADYNIFGLLLALNFFIFRENKMTKSLNLFFIWILWTKVFYIPIIITLLINLYNNKLSNSLNVSVKRKNIIKYVFYLFYPIHFIIIYILKSII
ncbi:TraX family protein [Peptostreptococcus canis]|uniref:TraX protein n=1 Tax=Peptostreptococcus canis TaxID=1159213 RepID=A0ABR6TIB2_9FIRM|nr:hypothetical protein [Peptostreptococcus canis]MBP1997663.1 hypothetical protein [Peptostreptococcus canis]